MRRLLLLLLLLPACGGDPTVVRGTLREDALPAEGDSLHVRVEEGGEPVAVRGGSFEIAGVPPGPVVLRVGDGEEELARMEVRDLPEGAELTLEEVRIHRESGLAFPGAIRLEGAETVWINGLRRAPPGAVPEEVEAGGMVLAVSEAADALLFRPADEALPDLRVVLTPGTEVETIAGDPASPGELEAGDPARVEGGTVGGMVVARRIVVPASRAAAEREAARGRDESRGRDEARGRDEGRGRGKEKKEERGKGKGNR